ncbi:MAG: hypothetical protein K9G49_05725 [Taibaiella sp.]|nr:hypothetical protein [Taibaiella sp.]
MLTKQLPNVCTRTAQKFVLLLLAGVIGFSVSGYSQKNTKKATPNVLLAGVDATEIPLKTIIANPQLITNMPGCKVTSFFISFKPKDGDYFGPFETKGDMIKENQINYLKEFTNTKVRIFLETIHVNCNGTDIIDRPVIVSSIP